MFNKKEFLAYCEEEYPTAFKGMSGAFLRSTVESLVDYALDHFDTSRGRTVYFLYDILQENMELGEIAQCQLPVTKVTGLG